MKKGGCQWEVAFGRGGTRPQSTTKLHAKRGRISIQRHVADLQIKILSKDTFKIGVAILKSLMQDQYPSASRFEQRQLYSTISKVATLLTTHFTIKEFWTIGLSLFKAAKKVITEVDELMHIRACIDLSHKFLNDNCQKKEVLATVATVSKGPSVINSIFKGHTIDHCRKKNDNDNDDDNDDDDDDDNESIQQKRLIAQPIIKSILEVETTGYYKEERKKEEFQSFLNHSRETELEPELDNAIPKLEVDFFEEDPNMRLARILTMEELSMEIQAILYHVNRTFLGRSQVLANEFISLQEAIQATFQEINNAPQGPPPAAKEEIEKLSIVIVTKHVLAKLGEGTQCAVCREPLVEDDIMQEMPCLHFYHPKCLRPWLEKHNSCPICRFELRTEDEHYEQQKQQDYEAKQQKKCFQIAPNEEKLLNM